MSTPFVTTGTHSPIPRLRSVRAVLLDVDAVLAHLPSVHAAAWKRVFDALLREVTVPAPLHVRPFDMLEDYRTLAAGRTGVEVAGAFLAARGMELPPGDPADPPGFRSLRAVEAYHDRVFDAYVRRYVTTASPSAMQLVASLARRHIPTVAFSPHRNARELLQRAGVLGAFRGVVDAREFAQETFAGPPAAELLIAAARVISGDRARTAAVVTSLAGARAARRAELGLVVALEHSRSPRTELALARAGAGLVIRDLAELLEPATEDIGAGWRTA